MLVFLATPAWVAWRRSVSTDPGEPAFHLHRYALYAVFPYVVFSVVRIPMFYLFDAVYWAPWQTFGFGSTGNPVGFWPSLISGAACYSLQGFALSMGFYTLFKRHNLLNALLYYFVFISSLYAFVFPVLLLRGSRPGLPFQFTNYWAHFWMGLTAVAVPVLFTRVWPTLRGRARLLTIAGLLAVWLTPYAFAFAFAGLWQFGTQARLERAAFQTVRLQAGSTATLAVAGAQARYSLDLVFGPREYVTYSHAHKAVGGEDVSVSGSLLQGGKSGRPVLGGGSLTTRTGQGPRPGEVLPGVGTHQPHHHRRELYRFDRGSRRHRSRHAALLRVRRGHDAHRRADDRASSPQRHCADHAHPIDRRMT